MKVRPSWIAIGRQRVALTDAVERTLFSVRGF
jgi:hypothetical protein